MEANKTEVFRKDYHSLVAQLDIECIVSYEDIVGIKHCENCFGKFDTGSSHTAISTTFADLLGVPVYQLGEEVGSLGGKQSAGSAIVTIQIGDLIIRHLNVWVVDFRVEKHPDILIGMDIICRGKLVVDSIDGNTKLTFDLKRDENGNPIHQELVYV